MEVPSTEGWYKTRAEGQDGVGPSPDDLVFVKADGTSSHPDVFSQLLDRAVTKIGVPTISLHDCAVLRGGHCLLLCSLCSSEEGDGHVESNQQGQQGSGCGAVGPVR